jgi:hypothetical protein
MTRRRWILTGLTFLAFAITWGAAYLSHARLGELCRKGEDCRSRACILDATRGKDADEYRPTSGWGICTKQCSSDASCDSSMRCLKGNCVPQPTRALFESCTHAWECQQGDCVSRDDKTFACWQPGAQRELAGWQVVSQRTTDGNAWAWHRIWGRGRNDIWAVGRSGTIAHRDRHGWATYSYADKDLRSIAGSADGDLWAVGDGGTALHFSDGRWSAVDLGTQKDLYGVWTSGAHDMWAVGDGVILHYDGKQVTKMGGDPDERYSSVVGDSREILVYSDSRVLRHAR